MKLFNIIYYFIWRFCYTVGKGVDKFTTITLLPFKWLFLKIPLVRNRYIKLYGSIDNAEKLIKNSADHVMHNQEWGFMMQFAWCFYGGTITLYIWGLYFIGAHYFQFLLVFFDSNKILCVLGFTSMAGTITYLTSYKKDIFKKYFKILDQTRGCKRLAYKSFTFVFVFGSFVFWLWTMGLTHHKSIF